MTGADKAPASLRPSVIINPDCVPDFNNPHTHLILIGDAADAPYPRVMVGCLRPLFREHANSAAAFAQAIAGAAARMQELACSDLDVSLQAKVQVHEVA